MHTFANQLNFLLQHIPRETQEGKIKIEQVNQSAAQV